MAIECTQINQTINYLTNAFDNCHKVDSSDLQLLVELVAAVYNCNNGGTPYDTLITNNYQPEVDEVVTYPTDTYHSINIMILEGTISKLIGDETVVFPTGTVLRHEVTTLNQVPYIFTVKANSNVVVEYLTINEGGN